jgi:hypothetical protein
LFEDAEGVIGRIWNGDGAAVVEKRSLVFLRKKEDEGWKGQDKGEERIIKRRNAFLSSSLSRFFCYVYGRTCEKVYDS